MRSHRKSVVILIHIGILLGLLLFACQPPPSPTAATLPSRTVKPPTEATPTAFEPTLIPIEPGGLNLSCRQNSNFLKKKFETTRFFVKDQVILTGPPRALNTVVDELGSRGFNLVPVILCELSLPAQIPTSYQERPFKKSDSGEQEVPSSPYYQPDQSGFVTGEDNRLSTNLYTVISSKDFVELFNEFIRLMKERPELADVYLDPNYLTGMQASSQCSDPSGLAGRPFIIEGSPFIIEGSPGGGMASPADPASFGEQWALQKINVNPPTPNPKSPIGKGVLVGVFDTSPYDLSPGVYETTVTEPITKPLMRLTVHHPFDLPAFAVSSTITTPVIVKDHGLFVSSLVYAADSLSEIHLYRVLDKMGCGTLYHLNLAMLNFISNDWNGKLKQPAVINLSLGIQRPRDLPPGKDPASYLPQLGISDGQIIAAYQLAAVDPTIESLRTVVGLAFRAGMVVVAAAGNDSVNEPPSLPGMPLGMQYPAWYSSVIGVSATDPEDNLSCYSNQGDVAAPGGAAEPGMSQTPGPTGQPVSICLPKADDCLTIDQPGQPSDCRYGLVGFSKESSTGYSYWVGTSFATPLVAGLAARSYENNPGNPGAVYQFITAQGPGVVRAP